MVKSSAPSPVLHKWVTHPLLCFRTGELHQGLEFRTWSLDLRPELAPDSSDWLWQLMLVRLRSMLVLAQAGQWDLFSKFHLRPATRNMLKNKCWRPCPGKKPRQTNGTWKAVLPLLTIKNLDFTLGFTSRFAALCAVQWQTPLKWNQSPELADTNGWQCPCEWSGKMFCG